MSPDSVDGFGYEEDEDYKPVLPFDNDVARKRRQRSQSSPEPSGGLAPIPTPSDSTSSSSHRTPGEDHLTLRRREANRLAAQRFRSRKKGYQDSLEEKVRQLEDDKELLVRRLTEGPSRDYKAAPVPEVTVDVDVRLAALESANRKLQDELKTVSEENERLREELDQWRRWEREQREASWAMRERTSRLPELSTLSQPGPRLTPNSFPSAQTSPPRPSTLAATTPGYRLPPIRLPPIHISQSAETTIPTAQYLPRPAELAGFGMGNRSATSPR